MRQQYRTGLDALRSDDPRWPTALQSTGMWANKRDRQDAAAAGLGTAIDQRRRKKAANRAKVNASRKHRLATI